MRITSSLLAAALALTAGLASAKTLTSEYYEDTVESCTGVGVVCLMNFGRLALESPVLVKRVSCAFTHRGPLRFVRLGSVRTPGDPLERYVTLEDRQSRFVADTYRTSFNQEVLFRTPGRETPVIYAGLDNQSFIAARCTISGTPAAE